MSNEINKENDTVEISIQNSEDYKEGYADGYKQAFQDLRKQVLEEYMMQYHEYTRTTRAQRLIMLLYQE